MCKVIEVPKRKLKGDDGYKVFSVRVPKQLLEQIDELTGKTELSRNEVINILLSEAVKIAEVK